MKYRRGYKYQLADDEHFKTRIYPDEAIHTYFITWLLNGDVTLRKGYAWDGASGPTWDTKSSIRGSAFHDAGYQVLRTGLLDPEHRNHIDVQFGKFLKEDGMWSWRANLWVRAVRKLGGSNADPENVKEVLTAP